MLASVLGNGTRLAIAAEPSAQVGGHKFTVMLNTDDLDGDLKDPVCSSVVPPPM